MAIALGSDIDGKYRILRLLGEGGMGAVYEGCNLRLDRRVAIKVLHCDVATNPEVRRRFEREARLGARLSSPHICEVLDIGDLDNGDAYIVMEFLEGESLSTWFDQVGALPLEQFAPIWYQVLEGLAVMHEAGVVHRDLKPANIFLIRTSRGQLCAKILDFGVSKLVATPLNENVTSSGVVMGTPLYMAPEQARGLNKDIDARTDLYAVGVIAYRALSGDLPFVSENVHDLLFRIALEDAVPLAVRSPHVAPEIASLIDCAMRRDPAHRFPSARAFQIELQRALMTLVGRGALAQTLSSQLELHGPSWRPSSGKVPVTPTPVGPFPSGAPWPSAPAAASSGFPAMPSATPHGMREAYGMNSPIPGPYPHLSPGSIPYSSQSPIGIQAPHTPTPEASGRMAGDGMEARSATHSAWSTGRGTSSVPTRRPLRWPLVLVVGAAVLVAVAVGVQRLRASLTTPRASASTATATDLPPVASSNSPGADPTTSVATSPASNEPQALSIPPSRPVVRQPRETRYVIPTPTVSATTLPPAPTETVRGRRRVREDL